MLITRITPRSILLLYLGALYLARGTGDVIGGPVAELSEAVTTVIGNYVTETQHATCKIAKGELVANARASISRVLNGACSSAKKVDARFERLEKDLKKELAQIKTILYAILEKCEVASTSKIVEEATLASNSENMDFDNRKDETREEVSPRREEIDKCNTTIRESPNGSAKVFTYYWQIEDFDAKLAEWETARSERSTTFYVNQVGYAMYLKVTPRYFPDGTIFVGVGLTRGRYDAILKWPFPLRTRIEIMDQSVVPPYRYRQDRSSKIWDPFTLCSEYFWGRPKLTGDPDNPICVGISIPREALLLKKSSTFRDASRDGDYLWNGSIIIKFTVYF